MDMAAPQAPGLGRNIDLDALRGFAVMGILAMNIVAFAMPFWAYITPLAYGGDTLGDRWVYLINYVLLDGKMRGFFSLLFGASMLLIVDSAAAKGESAAKIHYSRMFWLALFGLAHFYFIWFGDILFLYAVAGSIAFLFRNWQPRRLIKWGAVIFAIHLLVWGVQFVGLQALQFAAQQPGASPDLVKSLREITASPEFAMNTAKELALHRGSYAAIVADKLAVWWEPLVGLMQTLGETLPLMMLGMALKKTGFLTGELPRETYARWAWRLVTAGLLLSILIGAMIVAGSYDQITTLAAFFVWSAIPRTMLTVGYAALLILAIHRFAASGFIVRVAAAGRAAFTNYLGTSIVMTTIFYGYGFDMFGELDRLQLWGVVVAAWIVMLLWSKPWLERFAYGPFEWLWRSLARMQLQPLSRKKAV